MEAADPAWFGPLGAQQMWCGARQEAQPIWNALPAAAAAMHMQPYTGNHLSYSVTRTGPGSDLRPLYKTLAQKYRLLIFSGDSDGCVPFTGSAEWTAGLVHMAANMALDPGLYDSRRCDPSNGPVCQRCDGQDRCRSCRNLLCRAACLVLLA